jgi:sulfur-oxidizing protein SoxZ
MRLRAVRNADGVVLKVLMAHPMDTGRVKDQQVELWLDQERLLSADWGPAVAANPFLQVELAGVPPGATLRVRWRDNRDFVREDLLTID